MKHQIDNNNDYLLTWWWLIHFESVLYHYEYELKLYYHYSWEWCCCHGCCWSAFILCFVIFFSKRKKRALRRQSLWSSPQRKHRATTTMQNAKEDMHMWLSIHGPMHNAYAIVWCPVPGGIFGLVTTYMVMVFDSLFHGVWVLFFYSCWELWEAFLLVGLVLFVMDLLLQKLNPGLA